VALYNSTNGPGWTDHTNWLVTITPSNWFGVTVTSGFVTSIELFDNQLSGSIPVELGNLSSLTVLALNRNQLSGSVPAELGNLTYLSWLLLESNRLSGSLPPDLGSLSNLTLLHLDWNQLNGSLPAELGNLSSLTEMFLSGNQLSSSLPAELGNLANLQFLYLDNNQLSGSLPAELGNLTNLQFLYLDNNQLSGSLPPELGNLTGLYELWLQDNQLSGDIPPTFISLVKLYDSYGLDLDYNALNVPPGYPDPNDPLQVFLQQKDPDWQLYQGFLRLIGAGGGELTSSDGRTDLLIPPGALDGDTTFTYIPQPTPIYDSGELVFANNSFLLTATDTFGNPVTTFNLPVTVTMTYTDGDIFRTPEATLRLYYWDGTASAWVDVVTTCPGGVYTRDLAANRFALPLCHLTEFGVFGIPLRIFIPAVHR
jgi:hypothetical protein